MHSYTIYLLCVGTLMQQLQVCVFPADKTSQYVTIILYTFMFGIYIYTSSFDKNLQYHLPTPSIYIYIYLRWVLGTLFVMVFADNYFLIHHEHRARGRSFYFCIAVRLVSVHSLVLENTDFEQSRFIKI